MIFYYALLFALAIIPCALSRHRWPHVLVFWTVGVSLVLAVLVVIGAPVAPRIVVDAGLIEPQDPEVLQPIFMRNAMLTVGGAAIYVGLAQMRALRMPHALALLMLGTLYTLTEHDLVYGLGTPTFSHIPAEIQDDFARRMADHTAKMKQAVRITSFVGIAGFLGLAAYQIWLRLKRGPVGS
ncbi:hypothetical protein PVW46_00240 [Mameliella sp. AT18]|uniref:hypothetical protein n=1 Tax=Mameliella sp. AT18 TaxID=3028385 RepID=UPI000841190F|nr:hypothetical protein [Mameliella sp. AT18]MDD9728326.1 hypothetical protein [Mameliella sp. AT18]ODM47387.1 hypothetical protein A9320_22840 [Ruegeria sp. PBVC088]